MKKKSLMQDAESTRNKRRIQKYAQPPVYPSLLLKFASHAQWRLVLRRIIGLAICAEYAGRRTLHWLACNVATPGGAKAWMLEFFISATKTMTTWFYFSTFYSSTFDFKLWTPKMSKKWGYLAKTGNFSLKSSMELVKLKKYAIINYAD